MTKSATSATKRNAYQYTRQEVRNRIMGKEMGVYWGWDENILCLLGGLLIGAVAAVRMATLGRVTGSSGI